jgi:predicted dehydrogenase/nucleoside-diphosphate-sugar epimerase
VRRVGLVGAGFISHVHAQALRTIQGIRLSAVIDPMGRNARALASEFDVPEVFGSVQDALAADAFDCAHVLVPPDRHAEVAGSIIAAGKPVLVEKPLADTALRCAALVEQAETVGVALGVNQNFVHHPAFAKLSALMRARTLGRARHIACIYNSPLAQMATRQFSHWMFAAPGNLLLEQAVHPLSQIASLGGRIGEIRVLAGPEAMVASGQAIYPTLDAILSCGELTASLRFAVGQAYPFWQITVVCDDGVAIADMLANRFYTSERTQWLEAVDVAMSGVNTAATLAGASARNISAYGLSLLRLKPRSDAFFQSMRGSIAGFHAALDADRTPELDGRFGLMLVEACERIRDLGIGPAQGPAPAIAETPVEAAAGPHGPPDVAVLGGTGFIGAHFVRRCVADGLRVAVMARATRGLPAVFHDPLVTLHRGDIRDPQAVSAAIASAPMVVNLAHGGGGSTWEEVRDAMVGGAETVARACLAAGVRRLVHVGSIAALYLGPQPRPVTGATPPDPQSERREDYGRAKGVCDDLLLAMHAREGLPVVILRPGVVVGDGGTPFHAGLGFFNNEQHCIGWNDGRNALPFVLAEDVAEAILLACRATGVEGRCYNIVGDVRPSARDYIAALGTALQRPLQFHPQTALRLWTSELGKWAIKRAGGRSVPVPSLRDLLSRGMKAGFDTTDAKRDLGWTPVADPAVFHARAIAVHAD